MPLRLPSLACALLLSAGAALAAEDVSVEADRRGEGVEVRARALVAAPVALVWQVVTDYERLPSFVPGLARSKVRERSGPRVRLEQSGEASFLFFSVPIDVKLDVVEGAPHWVVSHAVSGNLRRMIGRYDLTPEAARGRVLLTYVGIIEPDFELPPFVGAAALRHTAEQQFRAMVDEIERQAAQR